MLLSSPLADRTAVRVLATLNHTARRHVFYRVIYFCFIVNSWWHLPLNTSKVVLATSLSLSPIAASADSISMGVYLLTALLRGDRLPGA